MHTNTNPAQGKHLAIIAPPDVVEVVDIYGNASTWLSGHNKGCPRRPQG
jgi:hypothetical protein